MRYETRKKVRRILIRWGSSAIERAKLISRLDDIRTEMDKVTDLHSPAMDGMPHASGNSDQTQQKALRLAELGYRYNDELTHLHYSINENIAFEHSIDEAVATLSQTQSTILDLKYRHDLSYQRIAAETSYSVDSCKRIEGDAIDALAKIIKVNTL